MDVLNTVARDSFNDTYFTGPKASFIALAHEMAGRTEAARAEWENTKRVATRLVAEDPTLKRALALKACALARLGETAEAESLRRGLEQTGDLRSEYWSCATPAVLLRVALGHGAEVADRFRSELKSPNATSAVPSPQAALRLNPVFDPIRADPAFQRLLAAAPAPKPPAAVRTSDLAPAKSTPAEKSVAVLAFANQSDDRANEYFSDGISEELINMLTKISGLRVIARTSAFSFKGKNTPVSEIAKQLGVAYVIDGSVRKSGTQVLIVAQLVNAATGDSLWSDRFPRELKDIFAVQEEIAGLIAKNLSLKLGTNPNAARSVNPEAFQSFLAGRAQAEKADGASLRAAAESFRRAGELDPNYAAAWAQLAWVNIQLARWGGLPQAVGLERARKAIAQAVALEPDSPDVLLALGWVRRTADWDWRGAAQAFRRALEFRPNHPQTLADAAVLWCNLGRMDEALQLAQRAVDLDPLNAASHLNLNQLFRQAGELAKSEQAIRRALQLAPHGQRYHTYLARILAETGRIEEAEREVAQETDEIGRLFSTALIQIARGRNAEALATVHALEAQNELHPGTADIFSYSAYLYVRLKDFDRAFASLERSRTARDTGIPWAKSAYDLRPLHHDPRWPTFLRQVGLADDQLK